MADFLEEKRKEITHWEELGQMQVTINGALVPAAFFLGVDDGGIDVRLGYGVGESLGALVVDLPETQGQTGHHAAAPARLGKGDSGQRHRLLVMRP